MVSDEAFYRVEGMSPRQIMAKLDTRTAENEDLVFSTDLDNGRQYDCNWIGGSYVEVRHNEAAPIRLDGQEESFPEVEILLERLLGSTLVEV